VHADTPSSSNCLQFTKLVALKGHADWIRCLSFTTCDNGDVLLASGAQDYYIRLWRFTITSDDSSSSGSSSSSASAGFSTSELLAALVPSALSIGDATTSISSRGSFFHVASVRYCVLLESVLAGHNDWVHSVRWHPPVWKEDGSKSQPMRLLSASMDKTMIIWAPRADQTASTYASLFVWQSCLGWLLTTRSTMRAASTRTTTCGWTKREWESSAAMGWASLVA